MRRSSLIAILLVAACSREAHQVTHPVNPDLAPPKSQQLAPQDREFLERAAEGNNPEIAMGAIAETHALQAEVVAFGRRMVADHDAMRTELIHIAKSKKIEIPISLGDHQHNYDRVIDKRLDPFDREFIRVILADHQQAEELFREASMSLADPQLKSFAAAKLALIHAHLEHAKSLKAIIEVQQ
jgi:putative membrane protein